jgi:transketolase
MAVPNLRVLAPCDPLEVEAITRWCTKQEEGPVYLRLGKAGEPELTAGLREPWQFGKLRVLRQGATHCLLTYGVITKMVLEVADELEHCGVSTSVVTTPTLKPLDREGLAEVLRAHTTVSVIEECAPRALGLEVEALAKRIGYSGSVETIALQDEFIHCFGTHADILAAHGLSAELVIRRLSARI